MDKLKTIESSIRRLEAIYVCNHEVMDADDQGDLLVTIKELKSMKRELLHNEYKEKVIAFRDYVLSTSPMVDCNNDTVELWDKFYELKWTVRFGDKEATLDNVAEVYQPIVDMLNDHIDEL